jgi:hypothetical protein
MAVLLTKKTPIFTQQSQLLQNKYAITLNHPHMKQSLILILSALTALLSSCSDHMHVYVPNTVNAPILQEKNELKGNITFTNYQLAYAVTDHIGIMANGQYVFRFDKGNKPDDDPFLPLDNDARGGLFEVGAGYFNRFGRSRTKAKVFEVYGGYGRGGFRTVASNYYDADDPVRSTKRDYKITAGFDKFFIQPGFGIAHKVVDFSIASRFSILHFNRATIGPLAFQDQSETQNHFLEFRDKWMVNWEPAATIKVGYKYVRFMAQLGFSVPFDKAPRYTESQVEYDDWDHGEYFQPMNVHLGVSFNFGKWLNEIK